jgi:hypothetical protein
LFRIVVQLPRPARVAGILRHASELEFRQEISERVLNLGAKVFNAFLYGTDIFDQVMTLLPDFFGQRIDGLACACDRFGRLFVPREIRYTSDRQMKFKMVLLNS